MNTIILVIYSIQNQYIFFIYTLPMYALLASHMQRMDTSAVELVDL